MPEDSHVDVVILAGGRATRFPGKLTAVVRNEPMLEGVVRRFATRANVIICGAPPPGVDLGGARVIADADPGRGPLRALVNAVAQLDATRLVVIAGDLPNAGEQLYDLLCASYREGDEAVVPQHDQISEPLAALYDRRALLRAAEAALDSGVSSMHGMLSRLNVRRIDAPGTWFRNVNTPRDLASVDPLRAGER